MAVLLARHNTVVGLDLDAPRIDRLRRGREPDPRRRHLALPGRGGARRHLHDRCGGGPHRRRLRDHRDADQLRPGHQLLRHQLDRGRHARRAPHRARRHDGREVDRAGGLHRGRARAARDRGRDLLPRVPPRGAGAARQPPPGADRRRRGLRAGPRVRRAARQGRRRRRRTRRSSPSPPRPRRSSSSPTPTSRCGSPTSTSSTPSPSPAASTAGRSSTASASTRGSAPTTTTRPSATAATACPRTPSSCWPTTPTSRRR